MALYTLGALFGALSCIFLGDKLGRKRTIQLGAAINCIGALLESTSFELGQLIVGRLVLGLGFGMVSATAPNWQSETSSAGHRGAAVLLESLFISLGLTLSAWTNLGMSFVANSASWRFPLAMSGVFGLIVVSTIPALPESPRWLLLKGRTEEARKVLAALEGTTEDDPVVESSMVEISESIQVTGQGRFIDVFSNGELRLFNRACLACAGQLFQQVSYLR